MLKTMKLVGAAALLALSGALSAQTVGIGTTKGGATAQVSAAIAKIVSQYSGLQMRPQPMGGTQQYIPPVNAGEIEFGIANMMQTYMAFTGTGLSEGAKAGNLRLVANMMIFRTGVLVRKDSDIKSPADYKGKRIPHGYDSSPLFHHLWSGNLANGGVAWDDVRKVPMVSLAAGFNAFKDGKIDAVVAAVGSGIVSELNASVSGGVRYVSMIDTPEARQRTLKQSPSTFLVEVKPLPNLVGISTPTKVLGFDYVLWAGKGVSNDVVYKVVKAMYEHEKELHGISALWRSHRSKNMAKDQGLPYHPGAIKYYRESGIWNR